MDKTDHAVEKHATFLLTWNPKNWSWPNLDNLVAQSARGRTVEYRWSCGNSKKIKPGDRLFLIRQGVDPKGIMGAGFATSASYSGPHWDQDKNQDGETCLLVDLRFERLLNPDVDDILMLDRLQSEFQGQVNWLTPASGIQIREVASRLEQLWSKHLQPFTRLLSPDEFLGFGGIEGVLFLALVRHRAREQGLRDAKIQQVKAAQAGRLPCEVCGFDFGEFYGKHGQGYAQIHHIKPLSERISPSLTKLQDLAVVCANCHAMLHRGRELLSTQELQALLALLQK